MSFNLGVAIYFCMPLVEKNCRNTFYSSIFKSYDIDLQIYTCIYMYAYVHVNIYENYQDIMHSQTVE